MARRSAHARQHHAVLDRGSFSLVRLQSRLWPGKIQSGFGVPGQTLDWRSADRLLDVAGNCVNSVVVVGKKSAVMNWLRRNTGHLHKTPLHEAGCFANYGFLLPFLKGFFRELVRHAACLKNGGQVQLAARPARGREGFSVGKVTSCLKSTTEKSPPIPMSFT